MELAQIFSYVFVAFASSYSLHRYYARQLGLSRIKSYIDSRESTLQSTCDDRLQTLRDAAIHLDVDVRKYSDVAAVVTQQTLRLEEKSKFLKNLENQMDEQSNVYRKYQKDMAFCLQQMRDHLDIFREGDVSYRDLEKRSKKIFDSVFKMEFLLQEIQKNASNEAQDKVHQILQKSEIKIEEELELCRQGMVTRLHQYATDLDKKNRSFEEQTKLAIQEWVNRREKSERVFDEAAQKTLDQWEVNFALFRDHEKNSIDSLVHEISSSVSHSVSHLQQNVGELQQQFIQISQKNILLQQDVEIHRNELKDKTDQSLKDLLDSLEDAVAQYRQRLESQVLSSMQLVHKDLLHVQQNATQLSQDTQKFDSDLRDKMGSVFVRYESLLQEFSQNWSNQLQQFMDDGKSFTEAELLKSQVKIQDLLSSQQQIEKQIQYYQNYLAEKADKDIKELVSNIQEFISQKSLHIQSKFENQFSIAIHNQKEIFSQIDEKIFPLNEIVQVLEDQVQLLQVKVETFSERLHPILDSQQEEAVQNTLQSWQKMTDLLIRERSQELITPLYEKMRGQVEDLGNNFTVALDGIEELAKSVRADLDGSKIVKEFESKVQLQSGNLQEMQSRTVELLQEVRKEFRNSEELRKNIQDIFGREKKDSQLVHQQHCDNYLQLVDQSQHTINTLVTSIMGSCENVEQEAARLLGNLQEQVSQYEQEVEKMRMVVGSQVGRVEVDVQDKIRDIIEEVRERAVVILQGLDGEYGEIQKQIQNHVEVIEQELRGKVGQVDGKIEKVFEEIVGTGTQKIQGLGKQYETIEEKSLLLLQMFQEKCMDKESQIYHFFQNSQNSVEEKTRLFSHEYQKLQEIAQNGFTFLSDLENQYSQLENTIQEHSLVQKVVSSITERQQSLENIQQQLQHSLKKIISNSNYLESQQLQIQGCIRDSEQKYRDLLDFSQECKNSFVDMVQSSQDLLQEKIFSFVFTSDEAIRLIDQKQTSSIESIQTHLHDWKQSVEHQEQEQKITQQKNVSLLEQKAIDLQEQFQLKENAFFSSIQDAVQAGLKQLESKISFFLQDLQKQAGAISVDFQQTSADVLSDLDRLLSKKGVVFEANLRDKVTSLQNAINNRQSAVLAELDQISNKKLKELAQWTSSKSEQVVFKQQEILASLVSYSESVRDQIESSKNNLETSMNGLVNQFKDDMTERIIYMDQTQTKFYTDVGEKSALEAQQDLEDFKNHLQKYIHQFQIDVQQATEVLNKSNQVESLFQNFQSNIEFTQNQSDLLKKTFEDTLQSQIQEVSAYIAQQKQNVLLQSHALVQQTSDLVQKEFAKQQLLWQDHMSDLLQQRKNVLEDLATFSQNQQNDLLQIRENLVQESQNIAAQQEQQYKILSSNLSSLATSYEDSLRKISGDSTGVCQSYLQMMENRQNDCSNSQKKYHLEVQAYADELLGKIRLESTQIFSQLSEKVEGAQNSLSQLSSVVQKHEQIESKLLQIKSWEEQIESYQNLLEKTQNSLSVLQKKHQEFANMETEITALEHQQKGLSRKVDQTMSKQTQIDQRFDSIEEQSILLESSHKKILEFNEKYSDLEVAINDIEQRRRDLFKLKEDLILESQRLIDLKEKLDDSVRLALKISSNIDDFQIDEVPSDVDLELSAEQFKSTVYTLYRDLKYTQEKIAKVLGKSVKEVERVLKG